MTMICCSGWKLSEDDSRAVRVYKKYMVERRHLGLTQK